MDISILSIDKKNNSLTLTQKTDDIKRNFEKLGHNLASVKKVSFNPTKIRKAVDAVASGDTKPDMILIADALTATDSSCFRKNFAETVASAERAENEPVPKDYWKKRNKAYKEAKKRKASQSELDELDDEFRMFRKKSRIFNLGDFGNGYRGYCFMYKGIKVGVLPWASLAGESIEDVITLAARRVIEVFERSAHDYPDGFSNREFVPEKTGFANRFIPLPGDKPKEVGRKLIVIAAFLTFLAAVGFLAYNMIYLSMQNSQLNGEIQKIAHRTEQKSDNPNNEEVDDSIDWDELKKINEDIVGWIQIEDTKIDYPVLWNKDDNRNYQFYLSHNYKGGYDSYGSIFVDYRCTEGTDSKNLVLHGHHMNDGSMFGDLMNYGGTSGNLDFYKKAPTIEFDTPDGDGTYKIISVFKTNTLSGHGEFFNYMIGNFQNEKDFMNYVYNVKIRSLINCPVDVNEDDQLLTLSTCSYEFTNFRTVVVARKVRDGESAKVDTSQASLNKNAVWPNVYYSVYGGSRPTVTDFCTAYEADQIDWYTGDYDFKDQEVQDTSNSGTSSTSGSGSGSSGSGSGSGGSSGSSGSGSGSSSRQSSASMVIYHTVTFINYDGSTISTQQVEDGKAATAPADPVKPSDEYYDYIFKGWELEYDKVKYDMSIAPIFEPQLKPEYQNGG